GGEGSVREGWPPRHGDEPHRGRASRAALQGPPGARSRRGVGVRAFRRRPRPGGRGGYGNTARGFPRSPPFQAVEDGGYGLFRPAGEEGTAGRGVPERSVE